MPLNQMQQSFVDQYLVDLNATQAAIRAGYSVKTAASQGQRLLKHPDVAEAVQVRRSQLQSVTQITQERWLREWARIGFSDLRAIFDADGRLKPLADLDDDVAAAIASVEVTEKLVPGGEGEIERLRKVKVWDKPSALTQIGRHFGWFTDKLELGATDELAARLDAAIARVAVK